MSDLLFVTFLNFKFSKFFKHQNLKLSENTAFLKILFKNADQQF